MKEGEATPVISTEGRNLSLPGIFEEEREGHEGSIILMEY
jgi:hypothetical protein